MKHRRQKIFRLDRAKTVLVTLVCTAVVLGIGYVGIVKTGKMILHNESTPKAAEYENTSSNIFYGKIDDDIELFPWNYVSEAVPMEGYPGQGLLSDGNREELEYLFRDLIARNSGVEQSAVSEYYQPDNITDKLVWAQNEMGTFCFYQDIIKLEGKIYQVRIACSEWSILSVSCSEYREGDMRDTAEWGEGKEALTRMLEQQVEKIAGQAGLLWGLYNDGLFLEDGAGSEGVYAYTEWYGSILGELNQYMGKKPESEAEAAEEESVAAGVFDYAENNSAVSYNKEDKTEYKAEYKMEYIDKYLSGILNDYSCQIIERSDLILLLVQGEITVGLYYDPIEQRFCGYHYFVK